MSPSRIARMAFLQRLMSSTQLETAELYCPDAPAGKEQSFRLKVLLSLPIQTSGWTLCSCWYRLERSALQRRYLERLLLTTFVNLPRPRVSASAGGQDAKPWPGLSSVLIAVPSSDFCSSRTLPKFLPNSRIKEKILLHQSEVPSLCITAKFRNILAASTFAPRATHGAGTGLDPCNRALHFRRNISANKNGHVLAPFPAIVIAKILRLTSNIRTSRCLQQI